MENTISVRRGSELGGRRASILESRHIRIMIADQGGMVSELSAPNRKSGSGWINAHWNPWFRGNGTPVYRPEEHQSFWKSPLLYHLAGNFPCVPNFGPDQVLEGLPIPPHGWSANEPWQFVESRMEGPLGWTVSRMDIHATNPKGQELFPLSFIKIDAIHRDHPVHYTSLMVENRGTADLDINAGWHSTVGSPFLETGCRISTVADRWHTATSGGEFDETGRLVLGQAFEKLTNAPLRKGGTADLTVVPPPLGFTDFVSGRVPPAANLGWSSVVNPHQKMLYLCFFTGPVAAQTDDIILSFTDLWMQYGGRSYTPWAPFEGGTDRTYCLGTENATGAFANGLGYARQHPEILDNPTLVRIPAHSRKVLRYGILFSSYENDDLDGGLKAVMAERDGLVCTATVKGQKNQRYMVDPDFTLLKEIEATL